MRGNTILNVLADPMNAAEYTTYFTPDAVDELYRSADSMNRKAMRNLIAKLEKKYKADVKRITEKMAADLDKAKDEMHEELGHFYMGSMYVIMIVAMKNAKLSDRTVMKVLNLVGGTLNQINEENMSISEIKDIAEEWGIDVQFDINRNFIKANMFERDVKDGGVHDEN